MTVFQINSPPLGPVTNADSYRQALAGMRTDLDAFGEIEVAALVNHGYETADGYIRRSFHDSPYCRSAEHWVQPTAPLVPMPDAASRTRRVVEAGRSRFFRSLRLGAPVSWLFVIAVLVVLALTTRNVRWSGNQLVAWAVLGSLSFLEHHSGLASALMGSVFPIGRVLVAAVAATLLLRFLCRNPVDWLKAHGLEAWARRVAFAAKWGWSCRGNVLWLFGFPLVALALLTLPFLAKTRNPAGSTHWRRPRRAGRRADAARRPLRWPGGPSRTTRSAM